MIRTYLVTWTIVNNEKEFTTQCVTREGYTTFSDIPKMIAIKRGVHVNQIEILMTHLINKGEDI